MELLPNPPRVLRFGVFEVDLDSRELRKSGMRQKLAGHPFEVLQILLEGSQQIITRGELRQRIWPNNTFIDYDLALKKAISRIREILGDSAESPRFIETIPRRGYRFIAPLNDTARATATATIPTAAVSGDSIAVLPFTSMSTDPQDELFADGMTEEIINALAQINQLHVVARTSAFSFKSKYIDVREVGRQLNVRTALLGCIRRAGTRLRITIQLVDVRDGCHLWSERYDRELKDIFDVQDEIARTIANRLKVTVQIKSQEPLVKPGTKNLQAYSLYVKGRTLLYRRGMKLRTALECFEQAVTLDSEYSLAWAGMADAYTLLSFYGFMHPEIGWPKWQYAARRALVADPSLAEAHHALAFGSMMYDRDKPLAEREFLCSLELNPFNIQARDAYAFFYLQHGVGKLDEGVKHGELALESDPLSCYANTMLALLYAAVRRFSDALERVQRAVELDSDSFLARWTLQAVLLWSSRFEEAVAAGQSALAVSGRHPWSMAVLTATLVGWDKVEEAQAVHAELVARVRREYILPSTLALSAGAVGRYDDAMRYAREAVAIRDPFRASFTSYWPGSARLRADSKIDQMLKDAGID